MTFKWRPEAPRSEEPKQEVRRSPGCPFQAGDTSEPKGGRNVETFPEGGLVFLGFPSATPERGAGGTKEAGLPMTSAFIS